VKLTTTMKDIRAAGPCEDGWEKLLKHMNKTHTEAKHDDTEFSLAVVLESNGLEDALWVLDNVIQNRRICTLFAADCAESVLHIFEAERPNDDRPRKAIAVARNPNATSGDMDAAGAAAGDAARATMAAWAAAGDAARATMAAGAAAGDAAWAAADAAGNAAGAARAAWAAARDAAWAARAAAGDAARATMAAGAAAGDAAWAVKSKRLAQYIEHGEAAAQMPWPEMEEA